jgi:hypothetical protein
MAYNEAAIARRRCTGTRRDGTPCRAFACWDDPEQRCVCHAGRHHTGPLPRSHRRERLHAKYPACRCGGYPWPHRPGGGLFCRWPAQPILTSPTPAGTHAWPRRRRPRAR